MRVTSNFGFDKILIAADIDATKKEKSEWSQTTRDTIQLERITEKLSPYLSREG